MKVRITKCSKPQQWYKDSVGMIAEVVRHTGDLWMVMAGKSCGEGNTYRIILADDCEPVVDPWRWIPVGERLPTELGEYPVVDVAGNRTHALWVEDAIGEPGWSRPWLVGPAIRVCYWLDLPPRPVAQKPHRGDPLGLGKCMACDPRPGKIIYIKDGKCCACGKPYSPPITASEISMMALLQRDEAKAMERARRKDEGNEAKMRQIAHNEIASVLLSIEWDPHLVNELEKRLKFIEIAHASIRERLDDLEKMRHPSPREQSMIDGQNGKGMPLP